MKEKVEIECPWIEGIFSLSLDRKVQISIVAYEHALGIPARFCMGLVPAITLSKKLESMKIDTVIRLINPTQIANYCNGWETKDSQFKKVISEFLIKNGVNKFFFDEAEPVSSGAIDILNEIGKEFSLTTDQIIIDMFERIKESGKKHGGELGSKNAILYMSAHPFSWLDMHHPLIWEKSYFHDEYQFVNLMSKSESRFTLIRKFLTERRPDLSTKINSTDLYMTMCDTPCYIPLEEEPTFMDLTIHGYDWCYARYRELKNKSGNHRRAVKDFESLMSFIN